MLRLIIFLAFIQSFACTVVATTVTYDWDITWVNANPDGQLTRPVIGINNHWPCPAIRANIGDRVVINVHNLLGNESTSIHFHGLFQEDSNSMDGPSGVTQCPIPPGQSFTYDFIVRQPGTYWYHSHHKGQYPDGLRGPFIVNDSHSPYAGQYDDEIVLTMSDWYHDQMPSLIDYYLSPDQNPDGAEPVPYSALINDGQNTQIRVKPGKTYFVQIINMAAFAQMYISFPGHDNITIIEMDGVYTKPSKAKAMYIATAQRYGVLLKTRPDASQNYAFTVMMDQEKFDNIPGYLSPNVTGQLVYDPSLPLAEAPVVQSFNVIDDITIPPYDNQPLMSGEPDSRIVLNLDFFERDGQNRAGFNNITYRDPRVPTLYTVFSSGRAASNPATYDRNTNPFVVSQGQLVEVVVNNFDCYGKYA